MPLDQPFMTHTVTSNPKPPGWGNDELSKFLEAAHQNQYATFVKKRDAMAKLVAIDAQFAKVTKGWLNPKSEILAMLFIRCHGAYRTACGLAMSGQAADCYVHCRSVLEYAAYLCRAHQPQSVLGKGLVRSPASGRRRHEGNEESLPARRGDEVGDCCQSARGGALRHDV